MKPNPLNDIRNRLGEIEGFLDQAFTSPPKPFRTPQYHTTREEYTRYQAMERCYVKDDDIVTYVVKLSKAGLMSERSARKLVGHLRQIRDKKKENSNG